MFTQILRVNNYHNIRVISSKFLKTRRKRNSAVVLNHSYDSVIERTLGYKVHF